MSIEMIEVEGFNAGTQIKVIGVGGGGGNAVEHMIKSGVKGVEFVCANTDAQALRTSSAHRVIQLGQSGLGAGSKPERGREAAEMAVEEIREVLEGCNMLFITAGMGGGTGTGAAPVVARVAREMGILTVGVVTKPFDWEGGRRMTHAESGLAELEENVDSLIVVLNEKLLQVFGDDISQDEAFAYANDVLRNSVGGIAEIINVEALVNVDFEDVRTVMSEQGKAMMGTAKASGPDRARIAAEQAVACPLLEGIDMSGAKGVLVLVTAAKGGLKLSESREAMSTICKFASNDAHVIYGTAYDEELGDEIRVTVVATGLSSPGKRQAMPFQVIRTGTDNTPLQVNTTYNNPVSSQPPAILPSSFNSPSERLPSMPANPFVEESAPSSVASMLSTPSAPEVKAQPVPSRAQPNYTDMAVPSVWRTNRVQAAAKVDALASGGMDDYEIPAFLRKQAD
jgi:cell division protein FtsZ